MYSSATFREIPFNFEPWNTYTEIGALVVTYLNFFFVNDLMLVNYNGNTA